MKKDYLRAKKEIWEKYLNAELPIQQNIDPDVAGLMFLMSDMYQFMKNTSSHPPNKLQNVLIAWMRDPTSEAVPLDALNGFRTTPFFGAMNMEAMIKMREEFINMTSGYWYDSGEYGEKWDSEEVSLARGADNPITQKLFEAQKKINEALFNDLRNYKTGQYDSFGAPVKEIIMPEPIGNIYDSLTETSRDPREYDYLECLVAKVKYPSKITKDALKDYVKYLTSLGVDGLQIGGGSSEGILYKNCREMHAKICKSYHEDDLEQFKIDIETFAQRTTIESDINNNFNRVAYYINRIAGKDDSIFDGEFATEAKKFANVLVGDLDRKTLGTELDNITVNTMFFNIISQGVEFCEVLLDIDPVLNNLEYHDDNDDCIKLSVSSYEHVFKPLLTLYPEAKYAGTFNFHKKNTGGIGANGENSGNYYIMSSMHFLWNGYYELFKKANENFSPSSNSSNSLKKMIHSAIDRIGLAFDFFIIQTEKNKPGKLYGLVC